MAKKISIGFNISGINASVKEVENLEKKFSRLDDTVGRQGDRIKALSMQLRALQEMLGENPKVSGTDEMVKYGSDLVSILSNVVTEIEAIKTSFGDAGVPSELESSFNRFSSTVSGAKNEAQQYVNTVREASQTSFSASLQKDVNSVLNTKIPSKNTSLKMRDERGDLTVSDEAVDRSYTKIADGVAKLQALEAEFAKSGGDIKAPKVNESNISTILQYTETLRALELELNSLANTTGGTGNLADKFNNISQSMALKKPSAREVAELLKQGKTYDNSRNKAVADAFKQYAPVNGRGATEQFLDAFKQANGIGVQDDSKIKDTLSSANKAVNNINPKQQQSVLNDEDIAKIERLASEIENVKAKAIELSTSVSNSSDVAIQAIGKEITYFEFLKTVIGSVAEKISEVSTAYASISGGSEGMLTSSQALENSATVIKDSIAKISSDSIQTSGFERLLEIVTQISNILLKGFKLPTLDDITAQYNKVATMFSALKTNKDGSLSIANGAKKSLQATAQEYQKYLDMGGTKAINTLTDNAKSAQRFADILSGISSSTATATAQTSGIRLGVDKEALASEVQSSLNAKQYTVQVKPVIDGASAANDISKQLEGYVASINIIGNTKNGVNSINTQIQEFKTAYDQYVNAINSGKQTNLAEKYPILSSYKKGADVEKSKAELTSQYVKGLTSDSSKDIQVLTEQLTKLSEAAGNVNAIESGLQGIKNMTGNIVSGNFEEQILTLVDGLDLLKSELDKIDLNNSPFFTSLNELLSKGNELSNLASVLKSSAKQVNTAVKATTSVSKASEGKSVPKSEINHAVQNIGSDLLDSDNKVPNVEGIKSIISSRMGVSPGELNLSNLQIGNALWDKGNAEYNKIMKDFAKDKQDVLSRQLDEGKGIESVKLATEAVKQYNIELKNLANNKSEEQINKTLAARDDANKQVANLKNLNDNYAKTTQVNKLIDSASKEMNQNGRMPVDLMNEYRSYVNVMNELKNSGKGISKETYGSMSAYLSDMQVRLRDVGVTGKSVMQRLGTSIGSRVAQFTAFYLSFYRLIGYMKQGISTLTAFDTTLTKISYTMDISEGTLNKMGDTMKSLASDLSAPLEKVEQIYTVYANMKTNPEEIKELTEYTTVLSNLSGIDASAAADDVQGVINQFSLTTDDVAHVVDTFDYISANIAVDYSKGIEGLAEAVQGSGNVARVAGLSFEQYAAIIAKTMEQTRLAGSTIGNGMRTIMTRLSKANKLDDTVDNSSLSDAAEALHNRAGIDVYTKTGEYREFDTIMTELASKWGDLTDAEQSDISFAIAATRQTATLKAILDNWTDSMNLATEAVKNQGSALRNNEKYEESYAGRIQKIKTQISNFAVDFFDDKAFNVAIDSVTKLTSLIEGLGDSLGSIPVLIGTIAGISSFKKNGALSSIFNYNPYNPKGERATIFSAPWGSGLKGYAQGFKNTWIGDNSARMNEISQFYKTYEATGSLKEANSYLSSFNAQQQMMLGTMAKGEISLGAMQGAFKKVGIGARIGSRAVNLFGSAVTGLLTGAIIFGLQAVITYFADIAKESETAKNNVKQLNDEFSSSRKERLSNLQTITSIDKDYALLSKGVDDLGNNVSLTTDEFKKYNTIAGQIADIMPSLVKGWTDEGNAIIDVASKYGSLTEAYREYIANQRQSDYLKSVSENTEKIDDAATIASSNMGNSDSFISKFGHTFYRMYIAPFEYANEAISADPGALLKFDESDTGLVKLGNKLLNMTDEDAVKELKSNDEYLYWRSKYTSDDAFDRITFENDYKEAKENINNVRNSMKNMMGEYIYSLDGFSVENKEFAEKITSLFDNSVYDVDVGVKGARRKMRSYVEILSGLTQTQKDMVSGVYNSPELTISDIGTYKKQLDFFSSIMGLNDTSGHSVFDLDNKQSLEAAKKYGFEEQYKSFYAARDIMGLLGDTLFSPTSTASMGGGLDNSFIAQYLQFKNPQSADDLNNIYTKLQKYVNKEGFFNTDKFLSDYSDERLGKALNFDFSKEWADMNSSALKKTKESLMSLAKAGNLTVDTFSKAEGADNWIKQLGMSAEDVIPKINQLADSAKQLSSLKTSVTSLRDAFGDKKDNGVVGSDRLASLSETFGKLKSWKSYESIAGTNGSSTSELKRVSDELLTEYVNSQNFLSNLNKNNSQFYIDQLSELGVANASDVVSKTLSSQDTVVTDLNKNIKQLSGQELNELGDGAVSAATNFSTLQNATLDEINALLTLDGVSQLTKATLLSLEMTKIDWSGLNAQQAINQLFAIAEQAKEAGISVGSLRGLREADKALDNPMQNIRNRDKGKGVNVDKTIKKYRKMYAKAFNNRKVKMSDIEVDMSTKGTGSKDKSSKKDTSSKSKSDTKETFDWLERRVTSITAKVDLLKSKLENLFTIKSKKNNLNKQIKQQGKLLKTYGKQVTTYEKKANSINLSSSLKKKVRQGKIKGSYTQLIQKYGEKTANKIKDYQDWWDKSRTARNNKEQTKTAIRQLKVDKHQLYVDKYNAKADLFDLRSTSGVKTASARNALLKKEYKALKVSYKHQIKIAKINHDEEQVRKLGLELENKRVELLKKQFDNVKVQYDRMLINSQMRVSANEGRISIAEAKGAKASVNYYRKNAQEYLNQRVIDKKELTALRAKLAKIPKGTDEYYNALEEVNSKQKEIDELKVKEIEELNKVREAYTNLYNAIEAQIERINQEQDFERGMTSNYQYFDYDTGAITDMGKAYSSSLMTSIYASKENLQNDKERLARLRTYGNENGLTQAGILAGYQSVDVLLKDIDDTIDMEQKHIKEINDQYGNVTKFVEDSLKKEEDLLKKLVDKRKEELDAAKDLYDYQKTINEKTKNINDLQMQISAYRGDTSQEGMSKLQQLQQQLADAQEDMQETEYDRYISDQKEMLDDLYRDYQELLEKYLSDFKQILDNGFNMIASYSKEGNKIMKDFISSEYGYNIQYDSDGSYSGIKKVVQNLENKETDLSGTKGDTKTGTNKSDAKKNAADEKARLREDTYNAKYKEDIKGELEKLFKNSLVTGKKKQASDYKTELNQILFAKNGGKVLGTYGLKRLRSLLGVSSNDNLVDILNWISHKYGQIKYVKGFSQGGMVGSVIKKNNDDGFATLKVGEAVLTPVEAKRFKKLVDYLPQLNAITDGIGNINVPSTEMTANANYGDISFNFSLDGVDNPSDLLLQIQNDSKIQKALRSVTLGRLQGGNRLGVKSIK